MRTTPDAAHIQITERLSAPDFGRVELARELVRTGAIEAVAIADLGRAGGDIVTRSLVVQARDQTTVRSLLERLAQGPLPDLSRPDPRTLDGPTSVTRPEQGLVGLDPRRIGPETRLLRATEDEVHTWLALFGRPGGNGISRTWRAMLSDLTPRIGSMLDATRVPFPQVSGPLALDGAGRILAADGETAAWLALEGRAERLPTLLAVGRSDTSVSGPLDGARIRLRAAHGSLGDAWLGTLAAPAPLERAVDALLTPTQRAVAEYAAVGATCAEIAATLGIRVETVRTHVRDIYARLGISTRAELARRWAPLSDGVQTKAA
ncbi:MAG: helix-turn-helix transcriptional regulator [Myxococcota bacterium]